MKWTPQDIKVRLAIELQKQGSSLEEFEHELSELNKQAAVGAGAAIGAGTKGLSSLVGALKGLGTMAAGTAAAAGLTGAAGLYGAYKGNQHTEDMITKKQQEKQQYLDALNSLRAAAQESKASGNY